MTRSTPNKRKSVAAATPGTATPKKTKMDPQTPKNPANALNKTPKSVKKGINMENGGTTPAKGKTPKSALKAKKMANGVNTPQVEPTTENNDENVIAKTPKPAKTPKSGKTKKGSLNTTTKDGGLQKFEGTTKDLLVAEFKMAPEAVINLNRNQKRRLVKRLKMKLAKQASKGQGDTTVTVAQKTSAEISQSPSDKKNNKKNKKNKSILNKSAEITNANQAKTGGKKGKGKPVNIAS